MCKFAADLSVCWRPGVVPGLEAGVRPPASYAAMWRQQAHLVEVRQHRVQALHAGLVLVLLQRDVEGQLGDGEAHAIQVARLAGQRHQLPAKVDDNPGGRHQGSGRRQSERVA